MENPTSTLPDLRAEGDPMADRVVGELLDSGELDHANQVLHGLRHNDQLVPEDLPDVLRTFLLETHPLPAWVDHDRVARVHAFFRHDGVHAVSALSLAGLVGCYAVPVGAKLLRTTHRLDHPHRRLSETTQFMLHLMAEDALGPHGDLIPTIQKVRLIHAAVRQLVLRDGHWDVEQDGVPICQDDLLGATLIFSVTVLDGMDRMGVHCPPDVAEDYYYVWRVVGVLLGLRADVIPETLAEGRQLWQTMALRYQGPSSDGVELTGALLDFYHDLTPLGARGAVPAMLRRMIGPQVADWMAVPAGHWEKAIAHAVKVEERLHDAEEHHRLARRVLDQVGRVLLKAEARRITHGQSTEFDIPATLCPVTTPDLPPARDGHTG
ncbi:oxygenase MpaB family protein [Kitasatospora sp. LaBMicrA B282]|uniref:oxygenase MpaB family protein n=1 Tax=Kitasatospora sp. LaBMicrA B282 TaxID=3420949 RepID=UPI003D101C44